jgi:hypothetical protein
MLVLYPEDKCSRILQNFRMNKTTCYISDPGNVYRHSKDDLKSHKSHIWTQKFSYIQDKELKSFIPTCDSETESKNEYCIKCGFENNERHNHSIE